MSGTPDRGPRHSDDTLGSDVILVEFVAEMVPHDSPEFRERAGLRGPASETPPPPEQPKPHQEPPAAP